MSAPVWLGLYLAGAGSALLLWRLRNLRGTTLTATWGWIQAALWAVPLSECLLAFAAPESEGVAQACRFLAATMSLCPVISQLGAKRPQHNIWVFIVGSFWFVISLPALEHLVFRDGTSLEITTARRAFVVVLIGLGAVNNLPHRFGLSAFLVVVGQTVLFLRVPLEIASATVLAEFCFVSAAALVCIGLPRAPKQRTSADQVWSAFRAAFGTLWTLRVAQRVNELQERAESNVRLGWNGFRLDDESEFPIAFAAGSPELKSFNRVISRFVTADWTQLHARSPNESPPRT